MPLPGKAWRHAIINTRGSWLHGDPRGFRSRDHRIHSSGDYKNPPPGREHEGLRRFHAERILPPNRLPRAWFPVVGAEILRNLVEHEHRVLCLSVGVLHAHFLVELPLEMQEARRVVGWCKKRASLRIADVLPGRVWAAGGTLKRIQTLEHQRETYRYILTR